MPRISRITKQHAGHVDADVGDVEHRPVRQREEVDDVPAEGAGSTEDPVDQVAGHPGEQQAEGRAPSRGGARAGRSGHDHDCSDQRHHGDHRGQRGAGAERRSRVAQQPELEEGPDHLDGRRDRSARGPRGSCWPGRSPSATAATENARAGAEQRRRGRSPDDAPVVGSPDVLLAISDAPRAACSSGTGWPGGTPSAGSCRSGCRRSRTGRSCRPRCARARAATARACRGRC